MTGEQADLSEVATSTLERLRQALAAGKVKPPITRASLLDHGIRNQIEPLEAALAGHTALACLSVLDVALAERRKGARPAPELVWTGPERANATARDTAVVLRALFERAQHQVIIAGYDFTKGSVLLEPLWIGMRDRGVDARLFVHIQQPREPPLDPQAYGDEAARRVVDQVWTFGSPRPRVYYDVRALASHPRFNMHAKCVVVDGQSTLITSANFTQAAHARNLECGVLIEDATFALHFARQWMGLIDAGLVVETRA